MLQKRYTGGNVYLDVYKWTQVMTLLSHAIINRLYTFWLKIQVNSLPNSIMSIFIGTDYVRKYRRNAYGSIGSLQRRCLRTALPKLSLIRNTRILSKCWVWLILPSIWRILLILINCHWYFIDFSLNLLIFEWFIGFLQWSLQLEVAFSSELCSMFRAGGVCQLRYHATVDSKVRSRPDIDSEITLSAALW